MKKIFLFFLVIWLSTALTFSGDPAGTELFPEVKGWELTQHEKVYIPSNLWDLINGAADSYLSYDFVDLHLADYKKGEGLNVRVELYRHSSYDNAFGIYTTERSSDYNFIDIGSQGYLEEGVLNFLDGYYYIKVITGSKGDDAQESLVLIANEIEQHLDQENYWPDIFQLLPPGLNQYSERYIAENFLGFGFLNSAFIADYNSDGEDFQVFMIRKDDPEEVREMLRQYLKLTKQDILVSNGSFTIHDPYNGDINVILKENVLAGIIGCNDKKLVEEYMGYLESKL
jgi:hypothetical protein